MIYFVDEDREYLQEFTVPLKLRGHEVETVLDADDAFEILEKVEDAEIVVIDIMLATDTSNKSRFNRADTDDFMQTGLLLMRYLMDARPDLFPKKFVVLTAASQAKLLKAIGDFCPRHKIEVMRKTDYPSPVELADKIESLLAET